MKQSSSGYLVRFMILSLLPVIAVTLYIRGQQYDPGLLDLSSSKAESNPVMSFFPDEIDDLSKGAIKSFHRDNLYEHVNGHAEYFISLGFASLTVADYTRTEASKPDISAEIYDMGQAANAFGVLMDETTSDTVPLNIGFMGFDTPRSTAFVKGKYFIRVSSFSDGVPSARVAERIDTLIGDIDTFLPQLAKFPSEGVVPGKIRFVRENYRGLEFLGNIFERAYHIDGIDFHAALVEGDIGKRDETVTRLTDYLIRDGIKYNAHKKGNMTFTRVADPFEGEWVIVQGKDNLFLLYGKLPDAIIERFS